MLPSVYLQDMWSAFFVHLKKSWFESHNYSDKGAQARDTFTCAARKENGTSYIDLASQQAYSLVQSCASGHVHEVVHTLRHLLAEAIGIEVIVRGWGMKEGGGRDGLATRVGKLKLRSPSPRTYPSTTTHPPCLPSCFSMFEHWPSLVTPYPTHLREGHNGAPPKALNSKLSFRPA